MSVNADADHPVQHSPDYLTSNSSSLICVREHCIHRMGLTMEAIILSSSL